MIISFVLIPSRYLAKADCRAKPGGAYFLSVGDTVFSPPTTDARLTIQFISLPTFHLEVRRILVFLIKLSSFLKQIFHIYHFLEKKHFYKKNLVVKRISSLSTTNQITKTASYEAVFVALLWIIMSIVLGYGCRFLYFVMVRSIILQGHALLGFQHEK